MFDIFPKDFTIRTSRLFFAAAVLFFAASLVPLAGYAARKRERQQVQARQYAVAHKAILREFDTKVDRAVAVAPPRATRAEKRAFEARQSAQFAAQMKNLLTRMGRLTPPPNRREEYAASLARMQLVAELSR